MLELLAGPWGPLVIFGLRIVDVSMGTTRFLLVTRGARLPASVLGFFEILVWIVAAGAAVRNLASPWHVVGYAAGFAAGTAVGMWLEEKLALGTATVQAFCRDPRPDVGRALREAGFGVTEVEGEGLEGRVDIISTVVRRRQVPRVLQTVEAADPGAFIAVYETQVRRGWLGTGRRK